METPRMVELSFSLIDENDKYICKFNFPPPLEDVPPPLKSALATCFSTGNALPVLAALKMLWPEK
jgi:hypothetical protein